MEAMNCSQALGRLTDINKDILQLVEQMATIKGWWVQVSTILQDVRQNTESIRASDAKGGSLVIRVRKLEKDWACVKDRYLMYKVQV
jgi:hypothetical protein